MPAAVISVPARHGYSLPCHGRPLPDTYLTKGDVMLPATDSRPTTVTIQNQMSMPAQTLGLPHCSTALPAPANNLFPNGPNGDPIKFHQ